MQGHKFKSLGYTFIHAGMNLAGYFRMGLLPLVHHCIGWIGCLSSRLPSTEGYHAGTVGESGFPVRLKSLNSPRRTIPDKRISANSPFSPHQNDIKTNKHK